MGGGEEGVVAGAVGTPWSFRPVAVAVEPRRDPTAPRWGGGRRQRCMVLQVNRVSKNHFITTHYTSCNWAVIHIVTMSFTLVAVVFLRQCNCFSPKRIDL